MTEKQMTTLVEEIKADIATMPNEAFGQFLAWIREPLKNSVNQTGGFQSESRKSLKKVNEKMNVLWKEIGR